MKRKLVRVRKPSSDDWFHCCRWCKHYELRQWGGFCGLQAEDYFESTDPKTSYYGEIKEMLHDLENLDLKGKDAEKVSEYVEKIEKELDEIADCYREDLSEYSIQGDAREFYCERYE